MELLNNFSFFLKVYLYLGQIKGAKIYLHAKRW